MLQSLPVELAVVQGMLDAMKGTNKPFIGSNGTGGMPETDTPADETVPIDRNDPLLVRQQAEELIVKVVPPAFIVLYGAMSVAVCNR